LPAFTWPALLAQRAAERPQHPALVTAERTLTWKSLEEEVGRLAAQLRALGVAPGNKVGILLPNGCAWVAWAYAIASIGAVIVPVNWRFRSDELDYQLAHSDTCLLVMQRTIGDTHFVDVVAALVPEVVQALPGAGRNARFPALRHVVCLDALPGDPPGMMSVETARGVAPPRDAEAIEARRRVQAGDPVLIQYTSGTTAFPKGAVLTHEGTARNAWNVNARLRVDADDRLLVPGPFFHVAGTTLGFLLGLLSGATVHTLARFEPVAVMDAIRRHRITVYSGVDSLFLALYKHPAFERSALASVEKGWIASSPEIVRMVQDEMGLRGVANVYGTSEGSPNVTIADRDDPPEIRAATCGRPHPGSEVKVVDPASGRSVPAGVAGEICFRGYSLMRGYYKNPEATARAIDSDGWFHSGDRGLLRASGDLEYHGRLKDMLRVGGENVAPAAVEETLCRHPQVRQAAVIGVPDAKLVEVPVAVVELKPGARCDEQAIVEFCRARLAGFKVPRRIVFVDTMPMTGSGKIQKFRLKELVAIAKPEASP
jgi:acyl-CoA synthetase (AMP-forming)/AMP-acid ligase II